MNKKIQVKILNNKIGKSIPLPAYTTSGSAAMDLRACINESIQLQSKKTVLVPTGLAFYIEDKKYAGIVLPRSGLGHKHGIILGNSVGLIDSDYQGELMVSLFNNSAKNFEINPGDRIAQMIIAKHETISWRVVEKLDKSDRGNKGFGSTGV